MNLTLRLIVAYYVKNSQARLFRVGLRHPLFRNATRGEDRNMSQILIRSYAKKLS